MKNNRFGSGTFLFRASAVALLGVGGAVGFWIGLANAGRANPLPPAVVVALAAVIAAVWLIRSRIKDPTHAVWNAYAEREIAEARPGIARRRRQELANRIFSRRDINARPQPQTR